MVAPNGAAFQNGTIMPTDVTLTNFEPRDKPFKVADRDGMYAHLSTSDLVTLRLDDHLNGRRETSGRASWSEWTLARCLGAMNVQPSSSRADVCSMSA